MQWTRRKKRLDYDTGDSRGLEVEATLTVTEKGEAGGKCLGKYENKV